MSSPGEDNNSNNGEDDADERDLFNGQDQQQSNDGQDGLPRMSTNDLNSSIVLQQSITHNQSIQSFSGHLNVPYQQASRPMYQNYAFRPVERVSSPVDDGQYFYTQENVASVSFPMFNDLRINGKLLDVDIVVDGKVIKAHKVVLAATIPYFQAMFTHDVIEATSSVINITSERSLQGIPTDYGDGGLLSEESLGAVGGTQLEPDDENDTMAAAINHGGQEEPLSPHRMDGDAFSALIDFAYTGSIMINVSNVQSILVGASYLGLQSVCDACSDYLQERLQSNNVIGIKSFAESLSCPNLVTAASKYIESHFEQVSKSEEFMALNCKEVSDIIIKDELNVRGEEVVFEAIINWIKFDHGGSNREQYLPTLLTLVRLPLLTPQFLADHVATESLIRLNHGCRDLLDEAKDYHLMPERRTLLQSFRTRPRNNTDNVGIIYAVGGLTKTGDSLSTVETYDVKEDRWHPAEAMSMLRSRVGVAVMGSKLYAIGGYNGTERLSTVEVFDPTIRVWSRVSSMNCKRSAVGAATLGNRLYVCGGYDGVSSLNTVECYNGEKNEWIMIQCMSKHRSAAGVVSFQGSLVALGGHDGLSIFDSVEKYDPVSGTWTPLPSMKTRRCRLGVAALGGKLFVCGGYDGSTFLQTAEVYDPETRTWSFIAPMNVMRSRVALVANCGKLFAIGGYDGVSNLSTVEVYDTSLDRWTFVSPMGAHEGGVGVGVIPNF